MKYWRTLLLALVLATPLMGVACNTVEGVGEDVQGAGRAIDRTAEDLKD